MKSLDLLIIGGGPAGLALAMTLAQRDPSWLTRMKILEKEIHPRHKLCGGGLTVLALKQLKRLGLKLDIPYVRVGNAQFTYHDQRINLPGQPAFVVTRRSEFDHWLAQQALNRGIPLQEGTEVLSIERVNNGLQVMTDQGSFLAKAIVGADGSRGIVRSWLGARERPAHVARLLEFLVRTEVDNPYFQDNYARFDFSAAQDDLQGYFWDFPTLISGRPFMNLGLYDGRVIPERDRARLPEILVEQAKQRGFKQDQIELEGHPIHWFSPTNTFAADRVLLIGDAAGAEPLFGEGIGIALAHSQPAADEIQQAFRRDNYHFKSYRHRLLISSLGRYLLLRWIVAAVLYRLSGHHRIMQLVWKLAGGLAWLVGSLPPVHDVLADQTEARD